MGRWDEGAEGGAGGRGGFDDDDDDDGEAGEEAEREAEEGGCSVVNRDDNDVEPIKEDDDVDDVVPDACGRILSGRGNVKSFFQLGLSDKTKERLHGSLTTANSPERDHARADVRMDDKGCKRGFLIHDEKKRTTMKESGKWRGRM